MAIDTAKLKRFALESGADLVGVAPVSRLGELDPARDPRFIAPKAKYIVGLGFRVLRGSLRGVEEGTHFYQFPEMGIVHIEEVHAPGVLRRVACFLEDEGYEGVVLRSVPDRRRGDDPGTNPEHLQVFKIKHSDPVAPGRPAPDVLPDFLKLAEVCGIAENALGSFCLSKRFGPLQRFAFVLTDADLQADPIVEPSLCDKCGECVKACPVQALSADGKLDEWQCSAGRFGADPRSNPFLPLEAAKPGFRYDEASVKANIPVWDEAYPRVRFNYNPSLCGVACQRACLAHLESKGLLKDKFVNSFRSIER